jgi:inorganic pyrophosphatase
MPNLARLPAWAGDELVHVVVETPRGARAKLTFDPELKTFVLSKSLMLGLSYPYDWGFIPSTRAEDGDPLDAMVIHDAATTPGLVLRCKLIGVLQTIQKTKHDQIRNDRVIAVPKDSHRERELRGVQDLPPEVKEELEKFFVATDELEAKTLKFLGWQGPAQAKKLVSVAKGFSRKGIRVSRRSIRQIANVRLRTETPVILQLSLNARRGLNGRRGNDAQQDR